MGWLTRAREAFFGVALPAGVTLPLETEEHVIAWARTSDDALLITTSRRLWFAADTETTHWCWHTIHKATWAQNALTITPGKELEPGIVADVESITWQLDRPNKVPIEVRSRITRSIAYSAHHDDPGVWVVARRVAGRDGLDWVLRFDPGVDFRQASLRDEAQKLLKIARREYVPG